MVCRPWDEVIAGVGRTTHPGRRSENADEQGFVALAAGADLELDLLAVFEGAVARAFDVREVDEHIVAVVAADESVACLLYTSDAADDQ